MLIKGADAVGTVAGAIKASDKAVGMIASGIKIADDVVDTAKTAKKVSDAVQDAELAAKSIDKISDAGKSAAKVAEDLKGGWNSELHHIATNKSKKFDFKSHPAFKETGINLSKDIDNLVELSNHKGRHTYKYHQEVQDRLDAVVERYGGTDKLESAVRQELNKMKQELLDGKLDPYKK